MVMSTGLGWERTRPRSCTLLPRLLEHHQGGNGGTQQADLIGEQQSQCQSAEDQQGHFRGHPGVECLELIHGRIQGPF